MPAHSTFQGRLALSPRRSVRTSLGVSIVLSAAALVLYLTAEAVVGRSDAQALHGDGTPLWRDVALAPGLLGFLAAGFAIKTGADAIRIGTGWRRVGALASIAVAAWALLLNGFLVFVDQLVFL
jgi:hypothetical protein